MAAFSSLALCEQRCRDQVANKIWLVGHSERDIKGVIKARFIRYMSPSAPDNGGWVETDQDNVN